MSEKIADYDCVIVGAGAAGLAAGRKLVDAGLNSVIIEASDRIGGRAWTDTGTFGYPFDRGCHWLHSASRNPFTQQADRLGYTYLHRGTRQCHGMHLGTRWATEADAKAAWAEIDKAYADADQAAEALAQDLSLADVIKTEGPWRRLVDHWMGVLSAGPPTRLSVKDLGNYDDSYENWPVVEGYGALIRQVAGALPIRTGVVVRHVDYSGSSARVETDQGSLTARHVIITVSTNVLALEQITFAPALPDAVLDAVHGCPTGNAEKVAFLLDEPLKDYGPSCYIDTLDLRDPARPPINFALNLVGTPLIVAQMGADVARELESQGDAAMVDFAKSALIDTFGSAITQRVVKTTTTHWASEPHIRGSYSYALPGKASSRAAFSQILNEQVLFAGEATSVRAFSTAHGAHQSGQRAATDVLRLRST